MKRYSEYKDSGVEWIGEVPRHWEIRKLKYLTFSMQSGDNLTSFQIKDCGTYPVYGGNGIRGYYDKHNCLDECLVIGRQGALCGNVHIIREPFWATDHAVVTLPNESSDLVYLYYLTVSMNLNQYASQTAAQPGLAVGAIKNVYTCVPTISEQQAIATYLDKKCSEIDKIISTQQKRIALLEELKQSIITHAVTKGLNPNAPMKDSGVEWIGEVPRHWEICRFKNFISLKTIASTRNAKIGLENIESKTGKFLQTDTVFEGNGVDFNVGDIVYGKLRPYLQKVWLAEFDGNAVGDFFVFKTDSNSFCNYVKYLLLSDGFTKEADGSTAGAKMPRVSSDFILSLRYAIPPLSEQQAIAAYLDKSCASIDASIQKANHEIELLQEYKQSLITEVVTGKRKVC